MCWICDHPGATERDYQDHMRRLIGAYGWAVQGVERDGIHPPWAYTVGLTPHRKPELVITGMGLARATQVLNGVAAHLLHAEAPEPGCVAGVEPPPQAVSRMTVANAGRAVRLTRASFRRTRAVRGGRQRSTGHHGRAAGA